MVHSAHDESCFGEVDFKTDHFHLVLYYYLRGVQYFGHLMRRVDSLEKTLMLGGIGGKRRRGRQRWDGWMALLTRWTWVSVNSGSLWWAGRPGVLRFMGSQRVGHDWATDLIWRGFHRVQGPCLAAAVSLPGVNYPHLMERLCPRSRHSGETCLRIIHSWLGN